jgi:hypothetical protein
MINRIKAHLKEAKMPYLKLHNDNILLLRSAGSHHYLLVQFYSMPDGWFSERRHFDIKIAQPRDYNNAIESINKYLKEQ